MSETVTYTRKIDAMQIAQIHREQGQSVQIMQTMIKRMPAPFKNVYGWTVMIGEEVTA